MENHKSPLVTICSFIVDKRNLFFLIYAILMIFSFFSQNWVSVENDLSAYLSKDTETRQAMDLMEEEYTTFGSAKVMVSNISLREAFIVCDTIKETPGVFEAGFLPEYLNPASGEVAKEDEELTIEEIREHYNDSSALFSVVFKYPETDDRCLDSLNSLKEKLSSYDLHISTTLGDVQAEAIEEEMKLIIVIVAAVVVLVLILTSETFGEVPVLLLTFGSAAFINKGTNYMMGTISFVSNSVAIVLQLALSIDYAIIFCNHFKEQRQYYDTRDAVIIALSHSIPEISSSSLTTVSGLLALLFMGYGLGRDLGLTLTKSIIISLLAVFTLMPGLLVLFSDIMMKTKHKNLVPKIPFVGKFAYATKAFIPPVFLVVILAGYFISSKCPYVYGYSNLKTPIRSASQITEDMIRDTFGSSNMIAINVPSHDYYKLSRIANSLEAMPEVKSVTSLANTEAKGGYMVSQPLTPRQFSEMADLDYDVAAMVYGMYASDKAEYGHIIGGIDKYRIPFLDIFMYQNLESYNGSRYNSGNYRYNDGYYTKRTATMVIRIPQEKLDDFVVTVTDLAHVTDRRESVEDVTLQYVDVKSHKESLEVEQARLLELLERAESLDDIITLENRLTNVRYQIESMESTLRTYDDLVDYSTVNLRIEEVEVYTPVEAGKETNWERMVNGLVQSLTDVRDGAINFVIWVVIHLPYLVIWAIVITIAVLIIKKKFKPKKAVQKAKEEKKD